MMSKFVAAIALIGCVATCSAVIADDRGEIFRMFQRREVDWNSKDVKALVNDFLEEGEYFNTNGESFVRRSEIEAHYKDVFQKAPKDTELKLVVERIRLFKQDLAIMDAAWILEAPDPKKTVGATSVAVMCKQGNSWKIASLRETIYVPRTKAK